MSLPKELEEAAIVDGCGRFRIFAQIMLPLIKPGIVECPSLPSSLHGMTLCGL